MREREREREQFVKYSKVRDILAESGEKRDCGRSRGKRVLPEDMFVGCASTMSVE